MKDISITPIALLTLLSCVGWARGDWKVANHSGKQVTVSILGSNQTMIPATSVAVGQVLCVTNVNQWPTNMLVDGKDILAVFNPCRGQWQTNYYEKKVAHCEVTLQSTGVQIAVNPWTFDGSDRSTGIKEVIYE